MYDRTCTLGPLPPYGTAIGWRPYGPAPVLVGPDRIPSLCASDLTAKNVRTAYYLGLISNVVLKLILHDDLLGLISVGSGQPLTQSSNNFF